MKIKPSIYKNLIDCWSPPLATGENQEADFNPIPIAFVSTTFTFDAEFFEEECLTRFLCLETERENDGAAFLIEREEKLASLHGGIVLADQHHCIGNRSLRWDLVPCRIQNGIMHAKITILHWSNCIRLIIGSANLTISGHCINQETFCSIDYHPNSEADLKIISETLKFLQSLTNGQCGNTTKKRFEKMQEEISDTLRKWKIKPNSYSKDEVSVFPLFVSPNQKNALLRLREIWDTQFNSPPDHAYITSPFFDSKETNTSPSKAIVDILQQRGTVSSTYYVTTEQVSDQDSRLIVNSPEFLRNPTRNSHSIIFEKVLESGENENGKQVPRPLHLKNIGLSKGDDMHLFMIGSSNFTSAALGLGKCCNYEANLVFCVWKNRNKKAFKLLDNCHPRSYDLTDTDLLFRQRENEDEITTNSPYIVLPSFFREAILIRNGSYLYLHLNFASDSNNPPKNFRIWSATKDKSECIFDSTTWIKNENPQVAIEWEKPDLPEYLLVDWNGSEGKAYWPIISESQTVLPPIESLKELPLEALIYILSSSQPLHRLIGIIERIKAKKKRQGIDEAILDPHRLVDTSRFLLQRTRRISYAMKALRNRLEKPAYTMESISWRLNGPIGVKSLKEAIIKEAKSEEERKFLLAELALELSRVNPQETEASLKSGAVKVELRKCLNEIADSINGESVKSQTPVDKYSKLALKKAWNELQL